jgi:hypothetical protein
VTIRCAAQRIVAAPFADVALPTIDPADIAEVGRGPTRRAPCRPHPHPHRSGSGISTAAGEGDWDALGTPLRFVEQSRDEARAKMLQFMPEPGVEGTLDILGDPLPVEQRVSPAVEQILGRAPRPFAPSPLGQRGTSPPSSSTHPI